MQNREHVISEYFKLKLMINRGNRTANERTETRFVILSMSDEELVFAFGILDKTLPRCIGLCTYNFKLRHWELVDFVGLENLINYCAELLNVKMKEVGLQKNKILSEREKNLLCDHVTKELRSLGI